MGKKIIITIALLLFVAALVVFFGLRSFAADEARKFLAEKGVPVQSLTLESLTPNTITLRDVVLGEDDNFKAKNLVITRLSGASLQTARIQVQADGIHLQAAHNGKGWLMGGVENLWQKPTSQKETGENAKQARFSLKNGTINMEGSLQADVQGVLTAQALHYAAKGMDAQITNLTVKPKMANQSRLRVPFTIQKIEARNEQGLLVAPLQANGTIYHTLGQQALSGDVVGEDLNKKIKLSGTIKHALDKSAGTVQYRTNAVPFGESGARLQLKELLPILAQSLPTPTLDFKTTGLLHYSGSGLETLDGKLLFNNLNAGTALAKALPGYGTLQGQLKGNIPFHLTPNSWHIKNGEISNQGAMKMAAIKGKKAEKIKSLASGIAGLFGKKVKIAAFDGVNISKLALGLNSLNDKGDLAVKGGLSGHNPLLKRPVNLNVDFNTNIKDLLGKFSGK